MKGFFSLSGLIAVGFSTFALAAGPTKVSRIEVSASSEVIPVDYRIVRIDPKSPDNLCAERLAGSLKKAVESSPELTAMLSEFTKISGRYVTDARVSLSEYPEKNKVRVRMSISPRESSLAEGVRGAFLVIGGLFIDNRDVQIFETEIPGHIAELSQPDVAALRCVVPQNAVKQIIENYRDHLNLEVKISQLMNESRKISEKNEEILSNILR